jgi:hypothetical protein
MLIVEKQKDINRLLQEFKSNIPTESDSTEKWSEFICGDNNIYHHNPDINSSLKNFILGTKEYNQNKINVLTNFFNTMRANQSLAPLAEMTVDCSGKPIPRLLLLCRGVCTDNKKEVLNACVLVYGLTSRRKHTRTSTSSHYQKK